MTSVEDQSASDLTRVDRHGEMLKDLKNGSTLNLRELERCDVTNLTGRPIYLYDADGVKDLCVFVPSEFEARLCAHNPESGSKYGLALVLPDAGFDLGGIPTKRENDKPELFIVPADVGMYLWYSGAGRRWPGCAFIGPDLSAGSRVGTNADVVGVRRFVLYHAPVEK